MSEQPLAPPESFGFANHSVSTTDARQSAPRVLVVDDDPGMLLLMRETLVNAGFDVATAASGPEAIEICPGFGPDLVLLDINMPLMDGIVACAEIRKQDQSHFPIIMVTSVDDALSIQRAFDAGATDFILKPLNWPLFQRRLSSVLAEWNRSHELDARNQRISLLEKVAPEKVMLVSRRGAIIEDLKERPGAIHSESGSHYRSLDDLYGAEIAHRFKQRISGVLKTARQSSLSFSVAERGTSRDYEAQFLVDGRDRVIVVVQDVSSNVESQNEIYDLAFFDATTNLPNSHLFNRFAEEILIDAGLHDRSLVLMSICFDNISKDQLVDSNIMLSAADRLRVCASNFDCIMQLGKGDNTSPLARFDINRFTLLFEINEDGNIVDKICDRFAHGFAERIVSASGSVTLTPRFGAATYPVDGRDLQTLMHAANSAMHEARETGKLVCFNTQSSSPQDLDTQDYGSELRQAMADGQLELYFQPRLATPTGAITCVEALLRWNHPIRGFVSIVELLRLAKATGLIIPLGNWVLRSACEAAQAWQFAAAPRVSVNLSQQEFVRRDLAERLADIVDQTGIDPARVDLEFTEAVLLRAENGLAELKRLKHLGVGLVLDDFGTGHSSLTNLMQYPIDALKIDRSFVGGLPGSRQDTAVCEVIITLAHKLGMKAVAEGVETPEQLTFLQQLGCDEFQGFHICKPLPGDDICEFLRQFGQPHR